MCVGPLCVWGGGVFGVTAWCAVCVSCQNEWYECNKHHLVVDSYCLPLTIMLPNTMVILDITLVTEINNEGAPEGRGRALENLPKECSKSEVTFRNQVLRLLRVSRWC